MFPKHLSHCVNVKVPFQYDLICQMGFCMLVTLINQIFDVCLSCYKKKINTNMTSQTMKIHSPKIMSKCKCHSLVRQKMSVT